MSITYNPEYKKQLYIKALHIISSKKFTNRQIDILSCIFSMRGNSQIAQILNVSTKTIENHIRDIYAKFENDLQLINSRDQLISFIEKSDKIRQIREYYTLIRIEHEFSLALKSIKTLIKKNTLNYTLYFDKTTEHSSIILTKLTHDLQQINFTNIESNNNPIINTNIYVDYESNINLSSDKIIKIITTNQIQNSKSITNQALVINFCNNCYITAFFKLLNYIYPNDEISKIYNNLLKDIEKISELCGISHNQHEDKQIKNNTSISSKIISLLKLKYFGMFIIIITILLYFYLLTPQTPNIDLINTQISDFNSQISSDNMNNINHKNYNYLPRAKKVADHFDNQKVADHFSSIESEPTELLNCLYFLQIIGSNYNYHRQSKKARAVLLKAKTIAENYILIRSNTNIEFDQLTFEEKYVELSSVDHLAHLYTRIIYMIGRTYIYQDNIHDAKPYFELSHYLGKKLELFEGYSSIVAGMNIINWNKITHYINSGEQKKAVIAIKQRISKVNSLLQNDKIYILDYSHFVELSKQNTMIPKKDNYNLLKLYSQLLDCYVYLAILDIKISNTESYLDHIYSSILGNKNHPGIINLLKLKEVNNRFKSMMYNRVGHNLIKLYQSNIDISELIKLINIKLEFSDNTLNSLLNIFNLSRKCSKRDEFTKADSYDGLVQVYKLILDTPGLKDKYYENIINEMHSLSSKRDKINQKLDRKGWRLKQF